MQTRHSPSVTTLHSLATSAAIPGYERLSKPLLFKKLQESFDLERLQRVEARRKSVHENTTDKKRVIEVLDDSQGTKCLSKRRRSTFSVYALNKYDPIMLTPLPKKKSIVWKFVRPNGSVIQFNAETLVDYILATGDFTDPETRLPFSDKDLKEIDDVLKKAEIRKSSVLDAKKNPEMFSEFKFRRDALQGLERCAGEVIADILTIIETCEPDEAQMRLIMRELPAFADYYRQLKEADSSYALQCMKHWSQFLVGPPNRPHEDVYGLIEIVLNFLSLCDTIVTSISSSHSNTLSSSNSSSTSSSSSSGNI